MAKKRKNKSLNLADQFRDLLLFELMGANIAKAPEFPIPKTDATFAEKKGLYAELLKHAQIELKIADGQLEDSGFDLIRKQLNGSGEGRGSRDYGGAESGADDLSGDSAEESSDA